MTPADIAGLIPRLRRRARRLTRCPEKADDMVQDTVLRLLGACARGRHIDNPEAYAMRILGNVARSDRRGARDWSELEDNMASTEPDALRRLVCSEIAGALARLPPAQAQLLMLVAEGETSPLALSQQTGLPKGTVMSRLARARARLRRDLEMRPDTAVQTLFPRERY